MDLLHEYQSNIAQLGAFLERTYDLDEYASKKQNTAPIAPGST
jgi:hypothetical protein